MMALLAALLLYALLSVVTTAALIGVDYELDVDEPPLTDRFFIFLLVPIILVMTLWEGEDFREVVGDLYGLIVNGKLPDDTDQ